MIDTTTGEPLLSAPLPTETMRIAAVSRAPQWGAVGASAALAQN